MKILIVGKDSLGPEELRYLSESRFQQESKLRAAEDLKTATRYLDRGDIDCIVLDLDGPGFDGRGLFVQLRSKYPDVPIVVTTRAPESLGRELIQTGAAADYLVKNSVGAEARFRRVRFAIENHRQKSKLAYTQLQEAAATDLAHDREDPDAITAHPRGLRTIHVPEIGPRLKSDPARSRSSQKDDAGDEDLPPLEVEVDVDDAPNEVEQKLTALSGKLDALLCLLLVVLAIFVGFLFWSRRPS